MSRIIRLVACGVMLVMVTGCCCVPVPQSMASEEDRQKDAELKQEQMDRAQNWSR